MSKTKDYHAMVTIYDAGSISKALRKKIAKWLKKTADNLVREGDDYTRGRFVARFMK